MIFINFVSVENLKHLQRKYIMTDGTSEPFVEGGKWKTEAEVCGHHEGLLEREGIVG